MSDIKIIDNFLDKQSFKDMENIFMSKDFPWYFSTIDLKSDNELLNYQFVHMIVKDDKFNCVINSDYFKYMNVFLKKLKAKEVFRIKLNLQTVQNEIITHPFHTDNAHKNCKTAIFYLNTNNGQTIIKNKNEILGIKSVANRMVVFNSNLYHAGTSHTDEKRRMVINFNYIED